MALELKNYDPALMYGANLGVAVDLTDITDQNGNEVIEIDGTASAVNYVAVQNSVTGSGPNFVARGDDTNIGMNVDGKGSGVITLNGTGTGNVTTPRGIRSTSATLGVGYGTGAGGTVTQQTDKSTGVTLNTIVGAVTMNNAALNDATTVTFTVTNSAVAAADAVIVNHSSAGTSGAYLLTVSAVGAGSFRISVRNVSGGALSEAIVITFAIIKGVTA